MTQENKLGITGSVELAQKEELPTKRRALEFYDEEDHLLTVESGPIRANEIRRFSKKPPLIESTTVKSTEGHRRQLQPRGLQHVQHRGSTR